MHVVLVHPDIPGNTGNVGRTCVANGISLHLVKPMGFEISDKHLKRAGLDYWEHLDVHTHDSLKKMEEQLLRTDDFFLFSRFGEKKYWEASFTKDSTLIFGSETKGLPKAFMKKHAEHVYAIPMTGPVRSLNLATAVGAVVYEALRQTRG